MESPKAVTQKTCSKVPSGKRPRTGDQDQLGKMKGHHREETILQEGGTHSCKKDRERASFNASPSCTAGPDREAQRYREPPPPLSAGSMESLEASLEMTELVSTMARRGKKEGRIDDRETDKYQDAEIVTLSDENMTKGIPMSEAIKIPGRKMDTSWALEYRECVRSLMDDAAGVPCERAHLRKLIKLQEEYMWDAEECERMNFCVWSCETEKLREEFLHSMNRYETRLQFLEEEAVKGGQRIRDLLAKNDSATKQAEQSEQFIKRLKEERDSLRRDVARWEERSKQTRGRVEDSKSWIGTMKGYVFSDIGSQLFQKADLLFGYLDPVLPRSDWPINGLPQPPISPRRRVTRPPLFVHIAINGSQIPTRTGDQGVIYCCAYELKDRLQKNEELSSGREVFVVVGPRLEHDVKREDYIVLQIIYLVSRIERSDRELYESFFGVKKLYAINCAIGAPNPSKDRNYIQQFKQLVGDMIGVLYMAKHKDGYSMKETENVETWRKLCQILMD